MGWNLSDNTFLHWRVGCNIRPNPGQDREATINILALFENKFKTMHHCAVSLKFVDFLSE